MRNLLLLLLVLGGVWLWRSRRKPGSRTAPTRPPAAPDPMLRCDVCGVHMPSGEAITTPSGTYCCAEHQRQGQT